MKYDVAVIGGGVIGAMVARELSRSRLSVCVLEKENDVAMGASKANSGIVHGGYDPEPGTWKAKMNTLGVPLLYETARQLNVPCVNNGSFVCAFTEEERQHLEKLLERGHTNGISGLEILTGDQARQMEPNLLEEVCYVLYIPTSGIICPYELTIAAMGNAMDNGVELLRNFEVIRIVYKDDFTVTDAGGRRVQARYLINCAGAYADKVAAMAGDDDFTILPRAGEYLLLDKSEGERVKHTIFQVPGKEGKGILVTPTVDGNLLMGPTAMLRSDPGDTSVTQKGIDVVTAKGCRSVPSVNLRQVITSFTGVRASVKEGDFIMEPSKHNGRLIHVAAIDSPGLTCCVAIGKYVADLLRQQGLSMEEKLDWNGSRKDPHAFRHMTDEEKNAWIQANPAYGKIVCRCEQVSEGEILSAIRTNPKALDLDAVKRRTRSGMGRCQGGFCSPHITKLLAKELGIQRTEVTKSGPGSEILIGKL